MEELEQKDIPTLVMPKPQADPDDTIPIPATTFRQRDWKRFERMAQIAMVVGVFLLIYFLALSIYPAVTSAYTGGVRPFVIRYWPNFLSVLTLVVLGFVLYTFRGYRSLWFGIAEMAVAAGIGWYAVNKAVLGDVSDSIIFLLAALYLSGRAWMNISSKIQPLQIDKQ